MRSQLLVLGIVAALAPVPARADDARVTARLAAERLATDATATHDEATFVACGRAYLDIYNHDPDATDNDEVLYNAAVCFGDGHSVSAQLQAFALLQKYFPRSKLNGKVLRLSAATHARIAYFDRAAEELEAYAAKYAGEKDAVDALADAIVYRTALGDVAKRIEDTKNYIRTYGRLRPTDAAAAQYALVSAFDGSPDDAIEMLRDYLKAFGGKLEPEQAIVAYTRLGDLLHARSCPVPLVDGLCVTVLRKAPTHTCSATPALKVVGVPRSAVNAQALDAYKLAIALYEKGPRTATTPRSTHAVATAKLAITDSDFERLLETSLPSDLDFDPSPAHKASRERSMKRFSTWVEQTMAQSRKLTEQYTAVLALKDVDSSLGGMFRLGQVTMAFWRALVVGEVPAAMRTGAFAKASTEAYCDALHAIADPLAARTVEVFETCLVKAAELGAGDPWVARCQREGQLLAPDKFVDATELHAVPDRAAPALAVEAPLR